MSAEFEQLVAQFERFQAQLHRVDEQFAGIGEMQQQLVDLEAVATSPDRAVTVVAGPSGSIKDIRLTEQAMRRSAHELAGALLSTLHQAVAEAARRQAGIVENALGNDMHLTDQVMETQAQLFGMTPEQLRATTEEQPPAPSQGPQWTPPPPVSPAGPPPYRPAPEPVDDFEERNVLRSDSWTASHPQAAPPAPPKKDGRYLNLFEEDDQ